MPIERYLDLITAALRDALGDALRAVYLTGSGAVGALRAGSDLDVLVAVEGADHAALEDVVRRCRHEAIPCPARKLELVVYELDVLATPGARPRWSLNLNTGADEHHVGFDPRAEPPHWFVLDLAFARRHARSLAGPPAAELIGPVDDGTVRDAFAAMVDWYERDEPAGAGLARARAEHWLATGEFASKARLQS